MAISQRTYFVMNRTFWNSVGSQRSHWLTAFKARADGLIDLSAQLSLADRFTKTIRPQKNQGCQARVARREMYVARAEAKLRSLTLPSRPQNHHSSEGLPMSCRPSPRAGRRGNRGQTVCSVTDTHQPKQKTTKPERKISSSSLTNLNTTDNGMFNAPSTTSSALTREH